MGMKDRDERMKELIDQYGCASACYRIRSDKGRYVLMESDGGSADNGGPWWARGDDPNQLLDKSSRQEYREDWPAELLFDLDSEDSWLVRECLTLCAGDWSSRRLKVEG